MNAEKNTTEFYAIRGLQQVFQQGRIYSKKAKNVDSTIQSGTKIRDIFVGAFLAIVPYFESTFFLGVSNKVLATLDEYPLFWVRNMSLILVPACICL